MRECVVLANLNLLDMDCFNKTITFKFCEGGADISYEGTKDFATHVISALKEIRSIKSRNEGLSHLSQMINDPKRWRRYQWCVSFLM